MKPSTMMNIIDVLKHISFCTIFFAIFLFAGAISIWSKTLFLVASALLILGMIVMTFSMNLEEGLRERRRKHGRK